MDNVLPNLGAEGFHLWLFSRFSRESNKGILCSNHPSEQGTKPGLARREKNSGATQGNTSMKNPGFQRALGTSCWLGIHPFSQESRAGWSLRVGIAPWPPKSQGSLHASIHVHLQHRSSSRPKFQSGNFGLAFQEGAPSFPEIAGKTRKKNKRRRRNPGSK